MELANERHVAHSCLVSTARRTREFDRSISLRLDGTSLARASLCTAAGKSCTASRLRALSSGLSWGRLGYRPQIVVYKFPEIKVGKPSTVYFFDLDAPSTSLTLRAAQVAGGGVSPDSSNTAALQRRLTRRERLAELLGLVGVGKAEGVPEQGERGHV